MKTVKLLPLFFILLYSGTIFAHDIDLHAPTSTLIVASIVDIQGVARALSDLGFLYSSGQISSQDCHLMAHQLGRRAFVLSNLSMAGNSDVHVCRSGFIHGLFEQAVARLDEPELTAICSTSAPLSTAYSMNCVHGLGHGLYSRFSDVNRSLAYCMRLRGPLDDQICAGGVFMDAFLGGHSGAPADANASDPFLFCQGFDYADDCFLYSAISVSRRYGSKNLSVTDCAGAPARFSDFCKKSIGVFSAKWSNYATSEIIASCSVDSSCLDAAAFESGFSGEAIKGPLLCLSSAMVEWIPCWIHLVGGFSLRWS